MTVATQVVGSDFLAETHGLQAPFLLAVLLASGSVGLFAGGFIPFI